MRNPPSGARDDVFPIRRSSSSKAKYRAEGPLRSKGKHPAGKVALPPALDLDGQSFTTGRLSPLPAAWTVETDASASACGPSERLTSSPYLGLASDAVASCDPGTLLSSPETSYPSPLSQPDLARFSPFPASPQWQTSQLPYQIAPQTPFAPSVYPTPVTSPVSNLITVPIATLPSPHSVALARQLESVGSGSSYRGSVDEGLASAVLAPQMSQEDGSRSWLGRSRTGADIGLAIEELEVLSTLGTGTFGKVLLVRLRTPRNDLPSHFAMKVLVKGNVARMGQIEHIQWERSILAGVRHPSIVNLICTFQDERNLYLLLEFVQGGELFSHLRRAVRFTSDVTRFYAANILLALEYLHDQQVIYRDLKPENLLLDSRGYIKITDFGFAKYVPLNRTFTLCGTPHFLSPETIRGIGHGKAADWWAFGVLLFEMLCGYPPFFSENPLQIYEQILAGQVNFPTYIDPLAKDLIRRLLASDLTRRLGNLRNGALDIKYHGWFAGVDWEAVAQRTVMAPIVPQARHVADTAHFERLPPPDLREFPALERASLRGHSGSTYITSPHAASDPYRTHFESFG